MVESTIDKIKDITVERQIRKLAGVIDEQNQKIDEFKEATTDINNLKESDANQTTQINNLKQTVATNKLATESAITDIQNKDAAQDETLRDYALTIQGITESLVSDIQIMPGTTTGEIKVRLEREAAADIDSNNYNLGLPVSAEIIQGTGPSMFKIQLTMSTGIKVVSNDFVFTTESIGTDVYISSFTFKAGNQDGYLSADIGLNNGVTIKANNFLVPTDPNVISSITDLQNRMTAVESADVGELATLKTTVGEHTVAITALDKDVADMTISKADVDNINQTIRTGVIKVYSLTLPTGTPSAVNPDSCTIGINESEAGKLDTNKPLTAIHSYYDNFLGDYTSESLGNVALLNDDGSPKNFTGGGEIWEEVDLNNWPTDWVDGDRIKIETWANVNKSGTFSDNGNRSALIEVRLSSSAIYVPLFVGYSKVRRLEVLTVSDLNGGSICRITNNNITTGEQTESGYLRTTDSNYNTQKNYFRILRLKK